MDKPEAEVLLSKYNRGEATVEEVAILESWYLEEGFKRPLFEGNLDYEAKRLSILSKIQQHRESPVRKVTKLWPRIAIAAAVALMVLGVYFFNYRNGKKIDSDVLITQDVAPGKVGATLTLSSGKKIRLSETANGKLAKEAGVVITKSASGELIYEVQDNIGEFNKVNTLSTAKGETYKIRLPDGSIVWLNSASSLTYSANLIKKDHRKVKLEGEAYFEITKDKTRPFVVESKGQQVEVLGTHFNINGYPDEPATTTTLLEGIVKIIATGNQQILKPGQQAINSKNIIKVSDANIENTMDWKNGDFYFDRIDFKVAMRKIERWYDVEIIYDSSVPDDIETGGWISRDKKLSSVLKYIESSGLAHFKIEGKKVYVSK